MQCFLHLDRSKCKRRLDESELEVDIPYDMCVKFGGQRQALQNSKRFVDTHRHRPPTHAPSPLSRPSPTFPLLPHTSPSFPCPIPFSQLTHPAPTPRPRVCYKCPHHLSRRPHSLLFSQNPHRPPPFPHIHPTTLTTDPTNPNPEFYENEFYANDKP